MTFPSVPIYAGEGVDVIEIGMASPDPFLDGPDVRQSMLRALFDDLCRSGASGAYR